MIDSKFKKLMQGQAALIYVEPLKAAMALYNIDTPQRASHFLAQLAHESAGFTRVYEGLNYSADGLAKTWPRRFADAKGQPNELALKLQRKPQLIANNVYASRMGNGDVASGDGYRYRGRGLIQLTGRSNYLAASLAVYQSDVLVQAPDKLLDADCASLVAAWFWAANGLNELADLGDVQRITKKINGGLIGLEHRAQLTELALVA